MDLVIEKLQKKDLKEAIKVYDDNHSLKTNYNKLLEIYDDIYNSSAYHNIIAKVDGKIVGLATLIINYDIVEELKPFLTIWNFGIRKEYRRKKIGTKMFEYIEKFARNNSCSFISLIADKNNKEAQLFYESVGYSKEIGYVKFL